MLLHGVPVSAFLFRKVLPELASRGLRGIAFDLPGLGLSDRRAPFDPSWTGLGGWCARAVDALGLDRFHLVVHDVGGPVGFDLVSRMPRRIASLTVLNTWVHASAFRRPWPMEPFARRGIGELWLRCMVTPAFVALMRRTGVATDVPSAEIAAHLRILRREDGGRAFLRIMRAFERTEAFEAKVLTALGERDFPAQVAWGTGDPFLRTEGHGEEVRRALGVDELHRLDARHFVPEDRPAEIAELVARQAA